MRAKKILLADDAASVLMAERMMLRGAGYDVVTARDGEEAVAMALSERPDLILLDASMPRLDGLEACRRLRAHESTREIPIILVTTRSEATIAQRAFDSGANECLVKPFDPVEVLARLRTYLPD